MDFYALSINLRSMLFRYLLTFISVINSVHAFAQQRCGTVEHENRLRERNPKRESIQQFEQWMDQKISRQKSTPFGAQQAQQTQSTYTIPVVVHIVHNGEAIGTGLNISDAQIQSQLVVLNNDFNRLNADQTNTPAVFQSVAGSFDIQFVLAKQDPNGIATNGIVRVKGSQTSWNPDIEGFLLKSQSYWPAESYVNIWVSSLTQFIGLAQLPVSSEPGLENSPNERLTDGMVVNYRHFGSIDAGNFDLSTRYNRGRTLTHEMGHFFGLRHVWGDVSSCSSTDYVNDTPVQNAPTTSCPSHPQTSCTSAKMFQNYLDYTDDACMNIFTQGQVARMNIILQNSPRRQELPTSLGSLPPSAVANDLGIKTILNPISTACNGSIVPSIMIRNYGTNLITNAQIQLKINGSVIETKNIALTLSPNGEQQIDFIPVVLGTNSITSFDFLITFVNSTTDNNPLNNLKTVVTTTPVIGTLPLTENFTTLPVNWLIANPDNLNTWQTTNVSGKSSIYMNFYDYAQVGATDRLSTPLIDLTSASKATLVFDYAYAQYPGSTGDRLRILASNNCRFDTSPISIFDKKDESLSTAAATLCSFFPGNNQWVTEVVSLDAFIGQSIQLAFEATNGNGNNLYITNVRIFKGDLVDVKLLSLESPSPVSCLANQSPKIKIRNNGNVSINSFTMSVSLNGATTGNQLQSGFSIPPNGEQIIQLNPVQLKDGLNQLDVSILSPNGVTDNFSQDNNNVYTVVVNTAKEIIPFRERFDSNSQQKWSIVSQGQQPSWAKAITNYSQSLFYTSFTNTNIGEESWLVSPVLDLTSTTKASLFFEASYAKRDPKCETLRILASTDCGVTFNELLFDQGGSQLAISNSSSPWTPSLSSDWRKNFVDLSSYVGKAGVRIAFVAINGNGNNLFLDNIDFFEDNSSTQLTVESPYAVYGGKGIPLLLTFNLDDRQAVGLQIYNSTGQAILETTFPETLNQTYSIDLSDRGSGVYILRFQIGNQLSSKKVYVGN